MDRSGLRVRGLTVVRRGRRILDEVTFEAAPGVLVVAGANGAGKSTLLRALATVGPITSGAVSVCGHDLESLAGRVAARRHLGFLPQSLSLPGDLRVREALLYAAWLQRIPVDRRDEACREAAVQLDLTDILGEKLARLSGGTRQRVLLAMVTIHRPDVLLLDEPTVGIDTIHRAGLRRLIGELAQQRTVLLSSHLVEDIELVADRVLVLDAGRVVFEGSPDALLGVAEGAVVLPQERPHERALRLLAGGGDAG